MQTFIITIKNADGTIASKGSVKALNKLAAQQIAKTLVQSGQNATVS